MKKYILFLSFLSFLLNSCGNLEKEVIVDLPPYERELVVECYLEDAQPYRLLLSESVSYFDVPEVAFIENATVKILHNNEEILLNFAPAKDPVTGKIYNYTSDKIIDAASEGVYTLEITDTKGRKLTGQTSFLPKTLIKEVTWEFQEKENDALEKALLLIRFDDDPNQLDFYRIQINRDSLAGNSETDFELTDQFKTGNEITLGTGYDYENGDTVVVSLTHMEKAYSDFIQSAKDAANANGNPFAQPGSVKSTVSGGLGVFTALPIDRKEVIIKK